MYNVKQKFVVMIIFFLFLTIPLNVITAEEGKPAWTSDQWSVSGPPTIHGGPAVSHFNHLLYLIGQPDRNYNMFYSVQPSRGYPEVQRMFIQGNGTSSPRVYPDLDDENFISTIWNERVYFGTDRGILYRVEGESMELGWRYDLSSVLDTEVSIEYTPVIYESKGSIMVIVATDNSLHALEDKPDVERPRLLWNISLEMSGSLNQPVLIKQPKDMGATIIATSTGGDIFALDTSGETIWTLNLEDSSSPPVASLITRLGINSEQFVYTVGRDTLNRIPVTHSANIENVAQVTIDEEYDLKTPTISNDGKTLWVPMVHSSHSKIHFINIDRMKWDDDYTSRKISNIDGKITGELLHMERKSSLMAVTTSGKLHCLRSEIGLSGKLWEIQLKGDAKPSSLHIISNNFSPGFVDTVIMVIYQGSGGTEGWDMSNLPKSDPFFTDDTDDIASAFCGLCYLVLGVVWVIVVIVIAIIFIIRRKKKTSYQGPPYG